MSVMFKEIGRELNFEREDFMVGDLLMYNWGGREIA